MALASGDYHCIAFDLPGIGHSTLEVPCGRKKFLAELMWEAIEQLGLRDVILVGHDVGGMIAYACLRQKPEHLRAAIIMNTVIPGVDPWDAVESNPYVWHFAFHSLPDLPELLVAPNPGVYFDYFYDVISGDEATVPVASRSRYVESYRSPGSLQQGFEFYRSFRDDELDNRQKRPTVETPVLYMRGEQEGGDIDDYMKGLWSVGFNHLEGRVVEKAGHFCPDEQPGRAWQLISDFILERAPMKGSAQISTTDEAKK